MQVAPLPSALEHKVVEEQPAARLHPAMREELRGKWTDI